MRTCPNQELIESYVAGDCSGEEEQALENHTTDCGECREKVGRAREALAAYGRSGLATVVSQDGKTVCSADDETVDPEVTKSMTQEPPQMAEPVSQERDFEGVFQDYKIEDQIGEGGVGTVWRAVQLSTHREVALKMLGRGRFVSQKARIRFEREVELTARLEHPNIARVYDSGLHRGMHYYAMELFEGEHLDRHIRGNDLTQRQVLELMLTVCRAVQYAHQRGVIHRDLKPSNIIVTEDGQPHIVDFGLAKTFAQEDKTVTVSIEGDVAGTPAYMSPEQARGDLDAIDTRTDVYSLGVIIFNVLTDEWPYDVSGSHYEVLKTIQEQEPKRPSKIVAHFDSEVEAILLKALAKDPSERYQSAAELANDINCWLKGLPISARAIDTLYVLRKLVFRHRKTSIVASMVVLILLSTSFISVSFFYRERDARKDLQDAQDGYISRNETLLVYANQIAFALFLERWYDSDDARARVAAGIFSGQSKESKAVQFLLDARTLDEKMPGIANEIAGTEGSFWHFIVGEQYFKDGDKAAAIEAYKRSVDMGQKNSETEDWFVNRARRKLDTLLIEQMTSENKTDGDGG